MPCTVTDEEVKFYERESNKRRFGKEETDEDLLEAVACSACRVLVTVGAIDHAPRFVQLWWEAHQKEDQERIEASTRDKRQKLLRKRALDKLTREERRAVGL